MLTGFNYAPIYDINNKILNCYENHANCFITKPVNFEKFSDIIGSIKDFWINIAGITRIKDE